ncbi:MAG: tRNA (adenosine(37)-N6)-threonylcarbamoyltransferase complex dimerization subunit type 1 TsaB [Planctomycetota bacterium]
MIALGIEASAPSASVALFQGVDWPGERSEQIVLDAACGAARGLAPSISELLARCGLAPADLDLIAVGLGPGGYTGTRLALATAKTLSFVLRKPILGVSSTQALAAGDAVPEGRVLAVFDARKGMVYGGLYEKPAGKPPIETEAPFLRSASEVVRGLTEEIFVVGSGLPVLERSAGRSLRGDVDRTQTAREVLFVATARYSQGERDRERDLLPLYLRPSEAEILFEKRRVDGNASV